MSTISYQVSKQLKYCKHIFTVISNWRSTKQKNYCRQSYKEIRIFIVICIIFIYIYKEIYNKAQNMGMGRLLTCSIINKTNKFL